MAQKTRSERGGRWSSATLAAALVAVLAAAVGLGGCEDKQARKRVDDELATVREERDELARQLDKVRGELKAARDRIDKLRLDLRTAIAEADARRGDREQTAGQLDKLSDQLNWLQIQYVSLQDKNQVLDLRIGELEKVNEGQRKRIEQLLAPPPPPTTQPTTQPAILDLMPTTAPADGFAS